MPRTSQNAIATAHRCPGNHKHPPGMLVLHTVWLNYSNSMASIYGFIFEAGTFIELFTVLSKLYVLSLFVEIELDRLYKLHWHAFLFSQNICGISVMPKQIVLKGALQKYMTTALALNDYQPCASDVNNLDSISFIISQQICPVPSLQTHT